MGFRGVVVSRESIAGRRIPSAAESRPGNSDLAANHQGPEGAWGPRPARCFCEKKPEVRLDGELEGTAWSILTFAPHPWGPPRPKIDYASFDPLALKAEEHHTLAVAWCRMDGGSDWHRWYDGMRMGVVDLQGRRRECCGRGSWTEPTLRERIRRTAIRCLTLEHYRCYFWRGGFENPEK